MYFVTQIKEGVTGQHRKEKDTLTNFLWNKVEEQIVSALQTYLLTYRTHLCAPPRGIASADFEQNAHL